MISVAQLKLCLVTQIYDMSLEAYLHFITLAIEGGVTSVQLRDKTHSIFAVRHVAAALKELLTSLQIPLIINDNVQLAKEIDADGVHLGQSDLSPLQARDMLGSNKTIGWSIETMEQLQIANHLDCIHYVAASAVFLSNTKQNCKTLWGLEGLKHFTKQSKHPVIAIGGINKTNIQDVFTHGAAGAAVISAIHSSSAPKVAALELIQAIH